MGLYFQGSAENFLACAVMICSFSWVATNHEIYENFSPSKFTTRTVPSNIIPNTVEIITVSHRTFEEYLLLLSDQISFMSVIQCPCM